MPLDVLRVDGVVFRRVGGDSVVSCGGVSGGSACCGGRCAPDGWATVWVGFAYLRVLVEDTGSVRGGGASGGSSRLGC
jgi:hypothetical protein